MSEAIIHDSGDWKGNPRTHVIVIGVSHYPFLKNGGASANDAASLGQLMSPVASAHAIAKWFIDEYNYPDAPTGTVAMLTSDKPRKQFTKSSGEEVVPVLAKTEAVKLAIEAWAERGNEHEDSRLVFAFCGHGYGYGSETSLLLREFDFRRGNPWEDALDLGKLRAGTEKYAAFQQLFLIDACRKPHGDLVAPGAAIGVTPVSATSKPRENFTRKRISPLIFSTGFDEPARARRGDLSVFTQAFLAAVNGMGARDDTDEWVVNNLTMLEAIHHVSVRLTGEDFIDPQQPQGADAQWLEFHKLKQPPIAPVYVSWDDGKPLGPGEIRYQLGGTDRVNSCSKDDEELKLDLPYGEYDIALYHAGQLVARNAGARSSPLFKLAKLV